MTGWRRLITATVRLAHRNGTRLRRRPADGRLLFEPVGETTRRSAERVRGIVTGAWALRPVIECAVKGAIPQRVRIPPGNCRSSR